MPARACAAPRASHADGVARSRAGGSIGLIAVACVTVPLVFPATAWGVGLPRPWGSVQTQNIVRHPDVDELHFIQQRNTLRLGVDWPLAAAGTDGDDPPWPWLSDALLRVGYRGVYDSIYDYTPVFRERDFRGRKPGRAAARDLEDLPRGARDAVKLESRLREAWLDVTLRAAPVRVRAGLQQIVWGEADLFRMLDRANPLDTSWHFVEEIPPPSFGWDDLRIPLWMLDVRAAIGTVGLATDVGAELYWNPGDWRPVKVAFLPRPWGVRLLDPLTNREDGAFTAPFGGVERLYRSSLFRQGDYRRNPLDNSQIGLRFSATWPIGTRTAAYYFHQRWAADDGTPVAVLRGFPDTPEGRAHTFDVIQRGTLPVEYVAPYVHTVGLSASHYVALLRTTLRLETVYDLGLPLFDRRKTTTFSPAVPGLTRRDYWKGMLAFDRPLTVDAVNDVAVFVTAQWFVHHLMHNASALAGPLDLPTVGARGRPYCGSAPGEPCVDPRGNGSFRDDVRSWESLVTVAAFTSYRAGTVLPVAGIVVDPVNSWSVHPFWSVAVVLGRNVTVDVTQRYFATAQGDVQKGPFTPWIFGTMRGRSETALRVTYGF